MSQENTPTARVPPRGSIIVYGDGGRRYRIAEVVGPAMEDAADGHVWFGVLLPDQLNAIELVDLATVVSVSLPGDR
jgi:hypothetical protein